LDPPSGEKVKGEDEIPLFERDEGKKINTSRVKKKVRKSETQLDKG